LDGWRYWVAYAIGAVVIYFASLGLSRLLYVAALVAWMIGLDVAQHYQRQRRP
jgi:hypothetical protein